VSTGPVVARPQPLVRWLSKTLVLFWARIWLRLSIHGRANVPATGPVLLVANHASYLDPPLIGVTNARFVWFLARQSLAKTAPLRWWLGCMGVALIDRDAPSTAVLRFLAEQLDQGVVVALFPEGTRSRDGTVGPFRAGVEFLVRRTGATVVPVGIDGTWRAFPRGARVPRPRRVVVRYGEPWPAERVLAAGGLEALRARVAELARAPLGGPAPRERSRVGQGPGPVPADPTSSSAGGRA
jgi:1-acyl-sn-glycerol-3-phosphate acyltransferase